MDSLTRNFAGEPDKFDAFVNLARVQEKYENSNEEGFSIEKILHPSKEKIESRRQMEKFVDDLGAPVFRILEAMYYIGSDIVHKSLNLPKQKDAALYCIITAILLKIKECGRIDYEIDTPLTDDPKETHNFYYTKSADCLASFVSAVMDRLRPYLKCDTISE